MILAVCEQDRIAAEFKLVKYNAIAVRWLSEEACLLGVCRALAEQFDF